jgi:hypothetical protein
MATGATMIVPRSACCRGPGTCSLAVENLDEIVMAMDDRRRGFPMHELLECRLAGIVSNCRVSGRRRASASRRADQLDDLWGWFRASPTQQVLVRGSTCSPAWDC